MSDTQNTPVPADEGENTPQKKPSLWSRVKARKARFANDHPFAAECGRQVAYGAAYMGGAIAIAVAYTAAVGKSSSEESPELESADPEEEIFSDDEE